MKKITAFLISVLLLISFCACDNSSGGSDLPEVSPPANTDVVPPASKPPETAPTDAPESKPDERPNDNEVIPDTSPEPSMLPEDIDELTVYINNSPVTVPVTELTGVLKEDVLDFSIMYDPISFKTEYKNNAFFITPVAEEVNPVDYMEICYISGGTADAILPSFADSYIDFNDIEFASYTSIGENKTDAEFIIAYNAEQYINAYLIDVSGGVVTVVLSSTGQNSEIFIWLNAFLSTFLMN